MVLYDSGDPALITISDQQDGEAQAGVAIGEPPLPTFTGLRQSPGGGPATQRHTPDKCSAESRARHGNHGAEQTALAHIVPQSDSNAPVQKILISTALLVPLSRRQTALCHRRTDSALPTEKSPM